MSQGAEPSEHRQASRCRRSTETTRELRQPNLRHQRSSRAGRRGQKKAETPKGNLLQGKLCKTAGAGGARHKAENNRRTKDIAPPQEQDRHLEPERLRNPLRVTCGRTCRGKLQAPQEEAQKETQVRGSTNAYPAQSRRREGRHSSAASERTHRNTQGQPGRRSSAKNCKASHRRRWPKRWTGRRS